MITEIENQVFPIIINSIVSIIGVVITIIGGYIINFIKLKNNQIIKDIGVAQYNYSKILALDIWHIVDEHFRIKQTIETSTENKINMFNDELKKKCPYITQEEIDFLRQTIAGEVNNVKNTVTSENNNTNI
jgi:hypothetical protein